MVFCTIKDTKDFIIDYDTKLNSMYVSHLWCVRFMPRRIYNGNLFNYEYNYHFNSKLIKIVSFQMLSTSFSYFTLMYSIQ